MVFLNLVQGMKLILDTMEEWGAELEHDEYNVSRLQSLLCNAHILTWWVLCRNS